MKEGPRTHRTIGQAPARLHYVRRGALWRRTRPLEVLSRQDSAFDWLMPPLGASRVSSTAARPAARTRSFRRCFSDSASSLRNNGQALQLCRWVRAAAVRAGGKHSPPSLRQGLRIAHQLGDQGLHPTFAGGHSSCRGHASLVCSPSSSCRQARLQRLVVSPAGSPRGGKGGPVITFESNDRVWFLTTEASSANVKERTWRGKAPPVPPEEMMRDTV